MAADLPGLIEGAHTGQGLGFQFLRHLERTRVLALLIDATSEHPAADAEVVERELALHSRTLAEKPRVSRAHQGRPPAAGIARGRSPAAAGLPGRAAGQRATPASIPSLLEELWRRLVIETQPESADHER